MQIVRWLAAIAAVTGVTALMCYYRGTMAEFFIGSGWGFLTFNLLVIGLLLLPLVLAILLSWNSVAYFYVRLFSDLRDDRWLPILFVLFGSWIVGWMYVPAPEPMHSPIIETGQTVLEQTDAHMGLTTMGGRLLEGLGWKPAPPPDDQSNVWAQFFQALQQAQRLDSMTVAETPPPFGSWWWVWAPWLGTILFLISFVVIKSDNVMRALGVVLLPMVGAIARRRNSTLSSEDDGGAPRSRNRTERPGSTNSMWLLWYSLEDFVMGIASEYSYDMLTKEGGLFRRIFSKVL